MKYKKNIEDQLKNTTKSDFIKALKKDNWERDITKSAIQVYRNPDGRRVTIHYHPKQTMNIGLLRELLETIQWSTEDLKRLKLIKRI